MHEGYAQVRDWQVKLQHLQFALLQTCSLSVNNKIVGSTLILDPVNNEFL